MSAAAKREYLQLLAEEIVAMYGLSLEAVNLAIKGSAINALLDEYPEYVDHMPLASLAENVHREMFS